MYCGLEVVAPLGRELWRRDRPTLEQSRASCGETLDGRRVRWPGASGAWASAWVVMLVALVLTVVGSVAVVTSDTLLHPEGFAALTAWDALLFVVSGLYWRARRPHARLGALQIVAGFGFCVAPLQAVTAGPLLRSGCWPNRSWCWR